jgi:hypothetical protein
LFALDKHRPAGLEEEEEAEEEEEEEEEEEGLFGGALFGIWRSSG